MDIIEFHSLEQQDEFIVNLFNKKRDGFFLDISAGHPVVASNSYTLEQHFGWTGFAFDIQDCEARWQWSGKRANSFVQSDATSAQLTEFLKKNIPEDLVVDYISVDVDADGTSLSLAVLKRILDSGIKFKAMTFEHEKYMHGDEPRNESRQLLSSLGYIPLFGDVKAWAAKPERYSENEFFEDWWIHPQYFDSSILTAQRSELYSFECIDVLREITGNTYKAQHNFCRSFPAEAKIWWSPEEERDWPNTVSQLIKYNQNKRDLGLTS